MKRGLCRGAGGEKGSDSEGSPGTRRTVSDRATEKTGPSAWTVVGSKCKGVLLEVHAVPDGDLGCVWLLGVEVCVSTLGAYWGTAGG